MHSASFSLILMGPQFTSDAPRRASSKVWKHCLPNKHFRTQFEPKCDITMDILCSVRSRGDQGSMGWGGGMDGDGEKAGVGGLAGCCHPAVCRMKAHSGVNLLEELESSAGCHLFSTLSTPTPLFSFSPVNRVISTALVSASHFSLSLSVKMALLSIALTSDVLMNQTHQAVF